VKLYAEFTNLEVISYDSFLVHPFLEYIYLPNNQIDAIDEKVIDNTAVITIDMRNNTCANTSISDSSILR